MASSDCQKCGFMIIGKETEVPLKEIRTEVSLKGFIANVESKLEYFNKETTPIETEFVFPLDSKTAVYKFEAEINGRHIVAECQEKSQAYETYQDAVHSGHSAMLLSEEENAGDVFKLRLGNLDALSKAVLTFSYVVELDVEVHGTVRFTLPTVLCPRYTPAPELIDGSDQNRPVDGDGNQDKPVDGDGNQNRPVDGDGNQDRPVDGDGNQNRPIDGDGDQNRPVDGDGDQNRPVDGDGDQNRPVDGDGNQDKPVDGDVNQNRPTEVEPQEKKTPVLDSPDVITEYGSGQFKMSFSASVSGGYKINKIASKNDDFSVSLEGNKTDAKVSLKESFKHDHDLSFDIQYEDFDKPEIVLEKGIPDKGDFMKSDVLMLNFLPSWSADIEDMKCEFIFVIDRSGSMGGHRIQKAKEALLLMLKSLPMDCYFNIVSFGSDYSTLFQGSQKYSKKTQKEALSLQEKMDADMGGTEILKPLQNIYNTKLIKGYSRQIFLLTDGSVSNTQAVIKLIKDNAASTRVFTFGIGDGCSTELIRQGASVSQGAATFVKDTERLQTKVLSVLKKSTMNSISDLSVKFDLPSKVQHTMVPIDLPCLFKGEKLLLYTVLNGDTKARYDSSLTLSAVCGDQKISHKVSFDLSKVESSSGSAPLHRLAAKAQLELMEQNIPEYIDTDPSMVTMSKATNIVCRYTAFVGVDKDSKVSIKSPTSDYYHDRDYNLDLCRRGKSAHLCSAGLMSYDLSSQQLCPAKMYKKKRGFGGFKFPSPFTSVMNFFRSSAPRESVESAVLSANRTAVKGSKSASNPRGFSLRKKHMHRSCDVESLGACMDSAPCDIQASLEECSLDEEDDDDIASRLQELQGLDTPNKSTEKKSKQEDRMIDLVTKQTFEGFWELDEGLASILGKTVKELHDKCPVKDMRVWATVLALAHLQMKYNKRKPEWQMIEEKATLWLFAQDLQGKKEEDLITEAKKVLS